MRKVIKITLYTILFLLIIFLIFILSIFLYSRSWEREFISNINQEYLVNDVSESNDILDEKIGEYVLSQKEVDFITFSVEEIGVVIYNSIRDILGESSFNLTNVYIEPSVGFWNVCSRIDYTKVRGLHSWLCVGFNKDDMETAQLYISKLTVQGIDIGTIFPQLLTEINQGLADALVTVNENNFSGRFFYNIELLEDSVIIKGGM